jgi:hypothetical protein
MSSSPALRSTAVQKHLAAILARFDTADGEEALTLAYSLGDIEESATLALQLIHKLVKEGHTAEEIDEILHQLGEEFRHILYHLRDPRYFGYLFEHS